MKKWTTEQVEAARANKKTQNDCEPWMQAMFEECPMVERRWWGNSQEKWNVDDEPTFPNVKYRISENWPPADQIVGTEPTAKPAFSTQYMLGGEPYHPEDDATELQRLIDGRDDLNDGIKAIRARMRRFRAFVAKKEGVKG